LNVLIWKSKNNVENGRIVAKKNVAKMAVSTLAADNDRVSFYGGGFERRIGIHYLYMGLHGYFHHIKFSISPINQFLHNFGKIINHSPKAVEKFVLLSCFCN
jgi:hypothetical protein